MDIQKSCEQCGAAMHLRLAPSAAAHRRYCSKACLYKSMRARPVMESLAARLSQRCDKRLDGCWVYTGANNGHYGQMSHASKTYLAHRAAYEVHKGPIPRGMNVCHTCDKPLCINPDHLWLGTARDNVHDMIGKRRNTAPPSYIKLDATKVADIKSALRDGASMTALARQYGVSLGCINAIKRGASWRHIKPSMIDSQLSRSS